MATLQDLDAAIAAQGAEFTQDVATLQAAVQLIIADCDKLLAGNPPPDFTTEIENIQANAQSISAAISTAQSQISAEDQKVNPSPPPAPQMMHPPSVPGGNVEPTQSGGNAPASVNTVEEPVAGQLNPADNVGPQANVNPTVNVPANQPGQAPPNAAGYTPKDHPDAPAAPEGSPTSPAPNPAPAPSSTSE